MKVINGNDHSIIDCPIVASTTINNSIKTETKNKLDEIQEILNTHNVLKNGSKNIQPRVCLPGISEILPYMYLCGAGVAIPCFMEQLKITCVINAAPELPDTPLPEDSKPIYLQIPVLDKGDLDLKCYFDEVIDLIEEVRQADGRCMVHCVAGVSRSATFCIAYLMKYLKMTLKDAFTLVRSIRPQIRPNIGFFRQLIVFEKSLFGETSVNMIYRESIDQEIPDVYEPEYRAMELFYQKHRKLKLR